MPKEHHKFIIGRDKAQQRKIELATATKIVIPRPSEQSDEVRIVGTREGVEKARHQIQMISDKQVRQGKGRSLSDRQCWCWCWLPKPATSLSPQLTIGLALGAL